MADNIFDTPAPAPAPTAPPAAAPTSSGPNLFDSTPTARQTAQQIYQAQINQGIARTENAPMQKAASTVLRRVGDVMEDFSFAPLLGIGATHPGKESYQAMMGDAFARLAKGDFSGFSDVAGEYGLGSTPQVQYEAAHDPEGWQRNTMQYLSQHPFVNAATTAVAEWFNPINKVVPHVAGLGGKVATGTGKLITKIPVVGPRIGEQFAKHADAVTRYFNRWHGLYKDAGAPAVQSAMQLVSETNAIPANARPIVMQIFGYEGPRGAVDGLSRAQHYEIGRLSQGLARDANVPEAAHGASLAERGTQLRQLLNQIDDEQASVGLLTPAKTFNRATYVPMQPEITYAEHAPEAADETAHQPGETFSKRIRKESLAPGKSKTYLDLDQVRAGENPAEFADKFDLAENVRQHYVVRMQNVAIERGLQRFAGVLNPESQALLRPLVYRLTRGNALQMFGQGQRGYMVARLWAAAEANRLAKLLAAEKAGLAIAPREIPLGQLIGKRTAESRFKWRLSTIAQDAMKAAGQTAKAAAQAIPELGENVGLGRPIAAKTVQAVQADLTPEEQAARDELTDLIGQHTTTVPGMWRTIFRQSEESEHLVPERYQEPAYRSPFGVYKSGGKFVFRVNDPEAVDPAVVEQARSLFKRAGYDRETYAYMTGAQSEQRASKFLRYLKRYFPNISDELNPQTASVAYDRGNYLRQGIEGLPKKQRYSRANEARYRKIESGLAATEAYLIRHGIGSGEDIVAKQRAEQATRGRIGTTPNEPAPSVLGRLSKKERARYENQREQTLKSIRRPAVTHAQKVGREASDQVDRLEKIDQAITARQINNEQARLIKMVAREMAKSIRRDLWQQITDESQPEKGWHRAVDKRGVPLLDSPSLRHQTVDTELLRFLRDDLGAPAAPASLLSRYWTTLNALARVGIVSNPIIHPTWNLGFMFLAAGGDLSFLNPLSARSIFHASDPVWEARATKAGANFTFSQGTFGLSDEHEATVLSGSMHELGTLGKMDKVASAAWRANQHLVFNVFERRYATELFRTLVEKMGKTDAEAAIMTRQALGDYTNLTRNERWLNNLFFFYPWMKTIVPFWIKKSIEAPQWWNAPSRAAQTYNSQTGDPGTSNPFTFALGHGDYYTPMLPQRVTSPFAQAATSLTPGAGDNLVSGHLQPVADYLAGHLNPIVSLGVDLWSTMVEPPQSPGFYVIGDKDAPAGTFWKQFGQGALGQFVYPFREGRGIFEGLDRKDYAPLLGIVPGGFVTVEDPSALLKAESGIRRKYEAAIKAATDPLVKDALRRKLQDDLDKLETQYASAPR